MKRRLTKSKSFLLDERMTVEYSTETPAALEGWTKDEKFDLNIGLKVHEYNIKAIQTRIPKKTEAQIQAAIDYFKSELKRRTAAQLSSYRQRRKIKLLPQIPLAKWADLMTETYNYKELQTESATAVRIIADFEKFPHPSVCNSVDFKKIYHYMADAMEGKPLPDDPVAANVFNHCIMESSAMSKAFIPKNEVEDTLAGISTSDCHISVPRPTKDGGLYALRYLSAQKNYNPLNIPEKYLLQPRYSNDV